MDKTPFQNEDGSSVEPRRIASEHAVVVKTKPIDVHSLPQKSCLSDSKIDENTPASDQQTIRRKLAADFSRLAKSAL